MAQYSAYAQHSLLANVTPMQCRLLTPNAAGRSSSGAAGSQLRSTRTHLGLASIETIHFRTDARGGSTHLPHRPRAHHGHGRGRPLAPTETRSARDPPGCSRSATRRHRLKLGWTHNAACLLSGTPGRELGNVSVAIATQASAPQPHTLLSPPLVHTHTSFVTPSQPATSTLTHRSSCHRGPPRGRAGLRRRQRSSTESRPSRSTTR